VFFRLLFLATLIPALYMGFRRGNDFGIVALVTLGSWGLSFPAWDSSNPLLANTMCDLLCAAFICVFCTNRVCLTIGLLYGIAASISAIYGLSVYPGKMYTLAYAHSISIIGHGQNILLLIGAMDDGFRSRIRDVLRGMGAFAGGYRFSHRVIDSEDSEKHR